MAKIITLEQIRKEYEEKLQLNNKLLKLIKEEQSISLYTDHPKDIEFKQWLDMLQTHKDGWGIEGLDIQFRKRYLTNKTLNELIKFMSYFSIKEFLRLDTEFVTEGPWRQEFLEVYNNIPKPESRNKSISISFPKNKLYLRVLKTSYDNNNHWTRNENRYQYGISLLLPSGESIYADSRFQREQAMILSVTKMINDEKRIKYTFEKINLINA